MAIVFYAGHGMEVGGENWLVPINAELRSDADIESEAISLRSISLQVSKARQLGLVILDACRNNPFAAKMKRSISTRAVARGLAPTEPTDNVLIAYAARDGTTADDGNGRNSPFTTALLRHIETPGLEISFLFRRVRDDVMTETKREQQPFVYGSLSKEEIYLNAPSSATKGTENSGAKSSDRNLFSAEDSQKVATIGAAQRLDLPDFTIASAQDDALSANSRFVGVWSNKLGWANGKGRHGMLIITEVSATGLARGYYLWGPPTKLSWIQDKAGYRWFAEYIVNDTFSIKVNPEVTAKLDGKNVITLSTATPDKPSEKVSLELRPVWQLVRIPQDPEPSTKSEHASRREAAPKKEAPAKSSTRLVHR